MDVFKDGILFRAFPTTLLYIFCKTIFTFKVIAESTLDPYDSVKGTPKQQWVEACCGYYVLLKMERKLKWT